MTMRHRLTSLLVIALLAGCGHGAPVPAVAPARASGLVVHGAGGPTVVGGNEVTLLTDGPAIFQAIQAALAGARRTIQVHAYQFGGDVGMRMVDAIVARHRAGVRVQVLVDPAHGGIGSGKAQNARVLQALAKAGIPTRDFAVSAMPKGPTWLSNRGVIDHAKLVDVDGEVALFGGMNFYDHGVANHDYMLRVVGPAASRLGQLADLDWRLSGDASGALAIPDAAPAGGSEVALAETSPRERSIRPLVLAHLAAARRRAWVEMLFIDDDMTVDALIAAKRRGVDVQVVLDPMIFGRHVPELRWLPLNGIPNWAAIDRLLAAQVPVFRYAAPEPHRNLHAKVLMVDDRFTFTGSANFTYRSLDRSREIAAVVDAPEVAAAFAACFTADRAASVPVKALTATQRALARLFDRVKRHIYDERRDMPAMPTFDVPGDGEWLAGEL